MLTILSLLLNILLIYVYFIQKRDFKKLIEIFLNLKRQLEEKEQLPTIEF